MVTFLFVLIASFGTIVFVLLGHWRWAWWWRAIAAVAIATFIVVVVDSSLEQVSLGREHPFGKHLRSSQFREVILFALVLGGMCARVLGLAIERRDARATGGPDNELQIDKWHFVYPMLFAIPTFGALLSQLKEESLSVVDTVLAFQTGFFWQTILKKSEPK